MHTSTLQARSPSTSNRVMLHSTCQLCGRPRSSIGGPHGGNASGSSPNPSPSTLVNSLSSPVSGNTHANSNSNTYSSGSTAGSASTPRRGWSISGSSDCSGYCTSCAQQIQMQAAAYLTAAAHSPLSSTMTLHQRQQNLAHSSGTTLNSSEPSSPIGGAVAAPDPEAMAIGSWGLDPTISLFSAIPDDPADLPPIQSPHHAPVEMSEEYAAHVANFMRTHSGSFEIGSAASPPAGAANEEMLYAAGVLRPFDRPPNPMGRFLEAFYRQSPSGSPIPSPSPSPLNKHAFHHAPGMGGREQGRNSLVWRQHSNPMPSTNPNALRERAGTNPPPTTTSIVPPASNNVFHQQSMPQSAASPPAAQLLASSTRRRYSIGDSQQHTPNVPTAAASSPVLSSTTSGSYSSNSSNSAVSLTAASQPRLSFYEQHHSPSHSPIPAAGAGTVLSQDSLSPPSDRRSLNNAFAPSPTGNVSANYGSAGMAAYNAIPVHPPPRMDRADSDGQLHIHSPPHSLAQPLKRPHISPLPTSQLADRSSERDSARGSPGPAQFGASPLSSPHLRSMHFNLLRSPPRLLPRRDQLFGFAPVVHVPPNKLQSGKIKLSGEALDGMPEDAMEESQHENDSMHFAPLPPTVHQRVPNPAAPPPLGAGNSAFKAHSPLHSIGSKDSAPLRSSRVPSRNERNEDRMR